MRPHYLRRLLVIWTGWLFSLLPAQAQPDSVEHWTQAIEAAETLQQADLAFNKLLAYHRGRNDSSAWRKAAMAKADILDATQWASPVDWLKTAIERAWWTPDKNLAYLYLYLGYYSSAEGQLQIAASAWEQVAQWIKAGKVEATSYLVDNALHPLGNTYTKLGEYTKARLMLAEAYRYYEQHPEEQKPNVMANLANDLAVAHRVVGDMAAAKALLTEALSIPGLSLFNRSVLEINYVEWLAVNDGKAQAQLQLNRTIRNLLQAPDSVDTNVLLASSHSLQANLFFQDNRLREALSSMNQAIRFGRMAYGDGFSRELPGLYLQRAELLQQLNRLDDALADCQQVLAILLPGFQPGELRSVGNPRAYSTENRLWEVFQLKGDLLFLRYRQSNSESDLQASLAAHEAAMEVEALQLRMFSYDESSLHLLALNRLQKSQAMEVAWELWRRMPNEERFFKALSIAERSRSLLLQDRKRQLDLMAGKQANRQVVRQLDAIDSVLAATRINLRDVPAAVPEFHMLEGAIDSMMNIRQRLKEQLISSSPLYAAARFGDLFFGLNDFQQQLPEHGMLVSFFLGEEEIYVFGLTGTETALIRLPRPNDLNLRLDNLHTAITLPYMGQPSALARQDEIRRDLSLGLYRDLLAPLLQMKIAEGLQRLWIIPDGIVGRVPFALLLTEQPTSPYYAEEPFLIRKTAISMASNLTLLYLQLQGAAPEGNGELLCVAPSYSSMASGSARGGASEWNVPVPQGVRLVFHLQEAKYLHDRYGGGMLYEAQAGPSQFLETVEEYSMLHFSGHAQPDSSTGTWNFLALEPEPGSLDPFSAFWQPQILALRLKANLVFLSACETSRGKFYEGEGHSSLARAFLYAGASSVVATLWQIDDSVSLRFSQRFYEKLETGLPKDVALQQTMLSMIDENRPPYAWGPYLVWGDPRPTTLKPQTSVWWWALGGGGVLLLTLLTYGAVRRKRRVT